MITRNWLDLSYPASVLIKDESTMSKENGDDVFAGASLINRVFRKIIMKKTIFQSLILTILLVIVSGLSLKVNAQNIYSRKSGSWTDVTGGAGGTGTWSTVAIGGTACGCVPTSTSNVIIGSGHNVIYLSSAVSATIASISVTGATLIFGNAATSTTLIVSGDVSVTGGGTIQSGSTVASSHILQVGGNFINSANVNFTANGATGHILQLSPLSSKTIYGTAATTTLYNLTVGGPISFGDNTATARTLVVTNNLTVNSGGTFQSGNTGSVAHTTQIGGNLTNNGTLDLTANSATNHTATFNGGTAKILAGSSTNTSLYKMSVSGILSFGDNANSRVLSVANDLTVSGTLQSGSTGAVSHTIQLVGNLIDNGIVNLAANSATNQTFTLSPATTKSISGTATTATVYNLNVNGPVNFGDNANTRTFSIANDMTIGSSGTLQSGNTAAIAHNLQIAGNLVDNGTLDLTANSATNQTLTFNSSSTKTISGSATSATIYNLQVSGSINFGNNANIRTLTVANDVTVNSAGSFQSGNTGALAHNIQIAGNLTNNGTLNFNANLATNHTVIFSNSSAKTIKGTSSSTTFFNAIINGTVNFGDNANTRVLTIANDFTVSAGFIFQSGSTAAVAHTVQIGGSLTNAGTYNQTANSATNQTVVFNSTSTETISGAGVFTFNSFTLQTGSSSNLNINTNISINGVLNFATNGIMIPSSTVDITLGDVATVTGSTANRYIQLDDSSSSSCQLIKTSTNNTNSWKILFPIGTSTGGYTPLDLSASIFGGTITANSLLAVKSIYGASITGQMRRQFRLTVTNNTGGTTTFSNGAFNYNSSTDLSAGDVVGNYTNRWYLSFANGTWFNNLAGTAPGSNVGSLYTYSVTTAEPLSNGTYYFALGNSTAFTNIWYSYQNGVWNDPDIWTLDPSGTTLNNPLNQIPLSGDQVVILSNITVTCNVNSLTLSSVTIQSSAILDMVATTGHNFGTVSGTGLLRIAGTASAVNLPSGTYTSFVASTGGTVEYYATSAGTYTVSATQTTYNNLLLSNSSNTAIVFVTAPTGTINAVANSLLINGTMNVTQTAGTGTVTWQINDGTATSRNITITGDLTVSANGRINAGTGAASTTITYNIAPTTATVGKPHSLTLLGNFTNNGKVQLFDITDAVFASSLTANAAPATSVSTAITKGNAVNVTFSGTNDQTITCNSQTDFYRFIVDKGTTQQALAIVISTAAYNMRLFAPSNMGSSGADSFNDGPTTKSNNALAIYNGTLKLQGPITIPLLNVSGLVTSSTGCVIATGDNRCNTYFAIPQTAGLWLNDANVNITVCDNAATNDNHRLLVGGLLKITNGTLSCGRSKGVNSGAAGTVIIEGGTLNAWQIRPTTTSTNNFSYSQSGGVVNVGMETAFVGVTSDSYARFSVPSTTSSFQMTGGEINIRTPTANSTTISTIVYSLGGIDIRSDAANYNVTGGTVNVYQNSSANDFGINTTAPFYDLNVNLETGATKNFTLAQSLKILRNLTLVSLNGPKLYCSSSSTASIINNLTIGGDLDIQSGAQLFLGTLAVPVASNTITFNGSGAQAWKLNNGASSVNTLSTVVMTKPVGSILTLSGSALPNNIPSITTALTLTSGTLADGGAVIPVTGTLSNSAVVTGTGSIFYNNAGASTIGGSGGTFSSLSINTSATIATSGNQTVTNTLRLIGTNSTLNIASYSLSADKIYSNASPGIGNSFDNNKRIRTAGFRNDGGLTLKSYSGSDLLFPVGVGTTGTIKDYNPVTINVTAATTGTICVRPVTGAHPNATNTAQCLKYFWRVTSSGFSTPSAVVHSLYTYNDATLLQGTLTTYTPARYDATTFTWYIGTVYTASGGIISTSPYTFSFGTNIDGDYTCGSFTAGTVKVFYSRQNGLWLDNTTWSNTPCTGAGTCGSAVPAGGVSGVNYPGLNSPVVIGDNNNSHTVTMNGNGRGSGSLYLDNNSVLDLVNFVSLNFGVNTTGTGLLRIASSTFPSGDFLNFIGPNGGTVEFYGTALLATGNYIIPANSLNSFCNLTINPYSTQTITLPASNLTIYKTLTKSGAGTAISDPGRTYTLSGDFNTTAGTFNFNTASGTTTITQTGNINISAGAALGVSSTTGTHTLSTNGNITNNGTLNCSTVLNVTFTGASNNSITGTTVGASTTLNKITVNKGTDQTYSLTLDALGTLTVPTNNWLTITNGTFNFNKTGSTITLTNTATNTYTILNTAKLKVSGGTVEISKVAADDSDLILNGSLEVAGGTVYVGNFSTKPVNNNDIEYASTGSPTITVSSGTLYVNGAIRRPTAILAGALVYNQTGGAVTVGGQNALSARAVFDIESNTGSVFNLKNAGTLTISKPITTSPSFADLYLNPVTSSVDAISTIYIGTAGSTQTITVNTDPALGGFYVDDNTTASMQNSTLRASGTITIDPSGILNTNSLDVTIGGDLTINGTGYYNGTIGSGNTTTFNGTGAQAGKLSSGSTFLNMTVNKSSGTLSLSGTSPTVTNLNILSGTLDVGTLDITVTGDIVNNSIETGTTGIILLGGTSTTQSITSSNGQFQNITLTGSAGSKIVTVTGNMTINKALVFGTTNRYLSIGSYQLTVGTSGTVTGASGTAFIKTNGVSSDLGVLKNWAAGTATFNYAVGTRTNYTPISMTLTVSTPGDMTVIPVDDRHPTANTASTEQILNYYWIITRGSSIVYSTTGSHIYAFPSALMGGTGGTLTAGYLDVNSSSPGWITNDATSSATTTSMSFNGSNLASNLPLVSPNNEFHYSVGTVNTLPNPIIPVYSRLADPSVASAGGGSWNSANSWTTQSDGMGSAWGAIPYGNYIVILPGAVVNADASGKKAFITEIQGNGVLSLTNGKVGHSLGILKGTGTLKTTLSTLPAGNYTSFVSSAGGTIEYSGPVGGTLAMNNARTVYNNIAISAVTSGSATTVTVPALDLTLNGGITIASNTTFNNSANRNISIGTNWANNGGTYVTGTGILTFNGSLASTITGATPFYNVTVNKTNNITLAGTGPTTINNTLTLTSGNIISISANKLTLPLAATISGGSSSSFIAGPMNKVMASGSTFVYPVGGITGSRYRPAILGNTTASDTWTVEYVGNDPSNQGYSHTTHTSPINKVSMFEYWNISRLGSTAADVTLTYNAGSYLGSDIGTVANLRVVHWNTATSSWEVAPGGGTVSQSGSNTTGTVTTTNQTSFSPDTFGSLDIDSPLPVQWLSFTANRVENSVVLEWATAQERNNDHFEIQRSIDGKTFDAIGSQAAIGNSSTVHRYKFTDREALKSATYYYRIKQVDLDGQFDFSNVVVITGDGKSLQRWAALPNPTSDNTHFHIQIMDESVDVTKSIQIQIISSNGVVVYEGEGQMDQLNKKLDSVMQGFGTGIYVVQISDGTYRENFRIARM